MTNTGLAHLLDGLAKCKKLKELKLYMGETGITRMSQRKINNFLSSKQLTSYRISGADMDLKSDEKG